MEKVKFKICFRTFLATVCLLFMGVVGANAQQGADAQGAGGYPATGVFSLPQGNFQQSQTALNTLMAEMISIKGTLAQIANESDPTYIALAKLVSYYTVVHQNITAGQTVAQAIVNGLLFFDADVNYLPPSDLTTLRNAAIQLLD